MGEVGVRQARGEGGVMETDRCGHGYVRPRNTGNARGSSPWNLGRLLNILLQLLEEPLKGLEIWRMILQCEDWMGHEHAPDESSVHGQRWAPPCVWRSPFS